MSGRTWVVADHHFGQSSILTFKRDDGTPLRPFKTIEEHDETIIERHNSRVAPEDRVYVLGDVCMHRRNLHTLSKLNGRLVLVKGNHDIFKLKEYIPWFDDIRAYIVQKDRNGNKVIMSHVPVHPDCLGRFATNIHGHLHYNRVMINKEIDTRYICVSLEHTDYRPIEIHEALRL